MIRVLVGVLLGQITYPYAPFGANTDKTTSIFDACRFYFFVIFLIKYLTDKHLLLVGFCVIGWKPHY